MNIQRAAVSFVVSLAVWMCANATQPAATAGLSVSADLLELFRAEMRDLQSGTQAIGVALPMGDWATIAATSEQIRRSYVLEKKLTQAQKEELESLPAQFRMLDEELHLRAEKLAHAASAKDIELVSFQYGRLLETCARCHSIYAQQRFPGFPAHAADSQHQ